MGKQETDSKNQESESEKLEIEDLTVTEIDEEIKGGRILIDGLEKAG
jgi:hypothetical protein